MNFGEILVEVVRITSRPDKKVETANAINKAISYCTLLGEFPQDTVEATIQIDPTLYGDTISLSTLTRFRRFKYIKPTGVKRYLTPIGPDKVFTPGEVTQRDRYYRAGTSITYTLSALSPTLEVSYLTYPAIVVEAPGVDTHWMLDIMPFAIIDLAASIVLAGAGDDISARRLEASGMQLYQALRRDIAQGE